MWFAVPRSNEVARSDPNGHGSGGRINLACRQAQRTAHPDTFAACTESRDSVDPGQTPGIVITSLPTVCWFAKSVNAMAASDSAYVRLIATVSFPSSIREASLLR
jgi:hypothetical protein